MPKRQFSPLQAYILKTCYKAKNRTLKKLALFEYFNINANDKNSKKYQLAHIQIIKTIDSLIKKGYLIGYGFKTQKEWHYRKIKLTALGKKKAASLLAIRKLPI